MNSNANKTEIETRHAGTMIKTIDIEHLTTVTGGQVVFLGGGPGLSVPDGGALLRKLRDSLNLEGRDRRCAAQEPCG